MSDTPVTRTVEVKCSGSGKKRDGLVICPGCHDDLTALLRMYPNSQTFPIHFRLCRCEGTGLVAAGVDIHSDYPHLDRCPAHG